MKSTLKTIRNFVSKAESVSPDAIEVIPLIGDASDRRFYRILLPEGNSRVVMLLNPSVPAPENPEDFPFINILYHLTRCKVSVPKLYHFDLKRGILIVEDLGGMTLAEYVGKHGTQASCGLYRKALRDLLTLQIAGTRKGPSHCLAFQHCFGAEKLMWELDLFLEPTVTGYLGRKIDSKERAETRKEFLKLCRLLAAEPRYFTHRDYHSRNLLVQKGKIGIVDFQDARLGPLQYDLCSLLRDAYVVLSEPQVEELIDFYLTERDRIEGTRTDAGRFRKTFDFMSIQRNLKAAGTFGYMASVKGNNRYLAYLSNTFNYVRDNLTQYPELKNLRSSLGHFLPEIL